MKKTHKIIILSLIILAVIGISFYFILSRPNADAVAQVQKNISTQYSDVKVTDLETAKESLKDVQEQLKITSLDEELAGDNLNTTGNSINTYNLKQMYNGLEVYNSGLTVYTDKQGTAKGIINNYQEGIDIDITPKSTEESLKKIVIEEMECEESQIGESRLVIYPLENNKYTLAHEYIINTELTTQKLLIMDNTEEILEKINPIYFFNESYMKDFLVGNDYIMTDNARSIKILQTNDPEYKNFDESIMEIYKWNSLESALAQENQPVIQAMNTIQKCYDYYKGEFNHISLDGEGKDEIKIITGLSTYFEDYKGNDASYGAPNTIVLGSENIFNNNIEALGHEYTHGVFYNRVGWIKPTDVEGQSLNEAYADIMGMCMEVYYSENKNTNIDGIICEELPEHTRDIKNSTVHYSEIDSDFEKIIGPYIFEKTQYYYSTIISRAAYLMSQSLTVEQLQHLWYDSMQLLYNKPTFYNCEYAIIAVAREMNLPLEPIINAFREVGIEMDEQVNHHIDMIKNELEDFPIAGEDDKPVTKDVYAYAIKSNTDGTANSIVGLKQDGTEQKILDTGATKYEAIDYSYGKLYLQKGTEFYSIDLSKGDGNYSIESIYKVASESDWYNKKLYVYDGIMYFNQGGSKVVGYDLQTKELKEVIASIGEHGNFVIDKQNEVIYYGIRNTFYYGGVIGKYDIKTGQDTELLREKFSQSEGTRLELGPITDNGIIIIKTTANDYKIVGYEYNVATQEQKKIDDDMDPIECVYNDGKIYYVKSTSVEVTMQNSLKVYDNGTIKDIIAPEYDEGIQKICVLKNGKIQTFQSRGQSEDSYSSNIYLIDLNTLEKTEVFDIYEKISYIVDGSEKYTVKEVTEQAMSTISKEELVGNWKATGTNSVENSLFMLFGSSISMANKLEFKQDGTYSLGVGFTYGEDGNYEVQGDTIKLTNIKSLTDNPDVSVRPTEAELKVRQEDGSTKIILEHKQDVYSAGKVSETLTIEIIFEKK